MTLEALSRLAIADFEKSTVSLVHLLPCLKYDLHFNACSSASAFGARWLKEKLNAPFTGVDMQEVPRMPRRPPAKPLEWYEAQYEQADSGMVAAYRSGDYTMKEIADWFGVQYATVSRALKKAENV